MILASSEIQECHLQELKASFIDPEIIDLNFKSLEGSSTYDYLLYSSKIQRRNDGRLRDTDLQRYRHIENGGWWCSGIDLLSFEDSLWGCFKPNTPRVSAEGKQIKYEHPYQVPTEIFALRVSPRIWNLIARRYDVALPKDYEILPYGEFWKWVKANPRQIPIILTEGAKKAAALLSCGYVALGLPGVTNACRTPKNEYGEKCGRPHLIPQLRDFLGYGQQVYFSYDQDTKSTTINNVNAEIDKTSQLLRKQGCVVKIIHWNANRGKGIDDVISSEGRDSFDNLYRSAQEFDIWHTNQMKRLTYKPHLELNQRYLGEIDLPREKQIFNFISPKNTGKTTFFKKLLEPIIKSGIIKVGVLSHRRQLGKALCDQFGIPYVEEIKNTPEGAIFGMGLCIDSLHPKSQAKFNPDDWKGGWLILDEFMQLLWHLLSSSTCSKDRVVILKNFKKLLENVLEYGGKIFIADADLNDIGIDFIKQLVDSFIDFDSKNYIIQNNFKFDEPWNVYRFGGNDPSLLVDLLEKKLSEGESEKTLLCTSGQKVKSKWGTRNLEAYFKKKYPHLRILRIDSETVADPNHPAYECTQNITDRNHPAYGQSRINEIIKDYDLVITSSVIETGVSIDCRYFDSVWGIYWGVQTCDSVRQHLSRERAPVNRYVWLNNHGINPVGDGSVTRKGLLKAEFEKNKANIQKLIEFGFEDEFNDNFEPMAINTWAKLGAIINAGMKNYAEQIFSDLAEEGHKIHSCTDLDEFKNIDVEEIYKNIEVIKEEVEITRDSEYDLHREEVRKAESVTDDIQYEKLSKKPSKTKDERLSYEKTKLERLYNVDVTADLIKRNDEGWYSKIRLHYYLGDGKKYLPDREKNILTQALTNGDGHYFIVDTNKSFVNQKVSLLEYLKIPELLKLERCDQNHPIIKWIYERCKGVPSIEHGIDEKKAKQISWNIFQILKLDFRKEKSSIKAAQSILDTIGYKLPCISRKGGRGEQVRIYGKAGPDFEKLPDKPKQCKIVNDQAVVIPDGREEVFKAWILRDEAALEKALQPKADIVNILRLQLTNEEDYSDEQLKELWEKLDQNQRDQHTNLYDKFGVSDRKEQLEKLEKRYYEFLKHPLTNSDLRIIESIQAKARRKAPNVTSGWMFNELPKPEPVVKVETNIDNQQVPVYLKKPTREEEQEQKEKNIKLVCDAYFDGSIKVGQWQVLSLTEENEANRRISQKLGKPFTLAEYFGYESKKVGKNNHWGHRVSDHWKKYDRQTELDEEKRNVEFAFKAFLANQLHSINDPILEALSIREIKNLEKRLAEEFGFTEECDMPAPPPLSFYFS